jgi:protein KIBRA
LALLPLDSDPLCDISQSSHPFGAAADNLGSSASQLVLGQISETSSGVSGGAGSGVDSAGGATKHSVSRGISSESVTESDSGVFDANAQQSIAAESRDDVLCMKLELAQVQILFEYDKSRQVLAVQIVKARNLSALAIPQYCQVCMKVTLGSSTEPGQSLSTQAMPNNADSIYFGDVFNFSLPHDLLFSKTLQIHVCCVVNGGEECWGYAMVSLASYSGECAKMEWYNILSFKFMNMQSGSYTPSQKLAASDRTEVKQDVVTQLLEASSARLSKSVTESTVKEESSDESTVISSQTSTLTRNRGPEDMERTEADLERLEDRVSGSESEDDLEDVQYHIIRDANLYAMPGVFNNISVDDEKHLFTYDAGTIRMMCNKETNTDVRYQCDSAATEAAASSTRSDQSEQEGAVAIATSSQSRQHDNLHSSSIRRWQTFSPTGIIDEQYVCRLSRSGSDSKVRRHHHRHFERHAADRRNVRVKKAPLSVHHSPVPPELQRIRTSVDLELDLQAYRVRQAQLNGEINSLREIKRQLEEAKAQGGAALERLMNDDSLQHYLRQIDRSLSQCETPQCEMSIEQLAQQRLARITKDVQRRVQRAQTDEASFMKKMSFFTQPSVTIVPQVCSATTVTTTAGASGLPRSPLLPRQ